MFPEMLYKNSNFVFTEIHMVHILWNDLFCGSTPTHSPFLSRIIPICISKLALTWWQSFYISFLSIRITKSTVISVQFGGFSLLGWAPKTYPTISILTKTTLSSWTSLYPILPSRNYYFRFCLYRFAYPELSYKHNHTIYGFLYLASFIAQFQSTSMI